MNRKRWILTIVLLATMLFGCGTQEGANDVLQSSQEETVLSNEDEEKIQPVEEDSESITLWETDLYASTLLEDEEAVYICGADHIRKVDKETGMSKDIWQASTGKVSDYAYTYSGAKGILVNDKIYFVENWKSKGNEEETTENYALSVVQTDGTGYERIEKIQEDSSSKMALIDGILYFDEDKYDFALKGYRIAHDGSLASKEKVTYEVESLTKEGYTSAFYYANGRRALTPMESMKKWGYYLFNDENYDLCRIYQGEEEKELLPELLQGCFLSAINDYSLLFISYFDNEMYLVDAETFDIHTLGSFEEGLDVITMDNEFLYLIREVSGVDFKQYHFEQIALENGAVTELFVIDAFKGMEADSPTALMKGSILNGYLYYTGVQDYKFYVMRRALDMPNAEENVGDPFYDSHIGEVGTIETFQENIYSENSPETALFSLDLEWLKVDDRFPGASGINQIIEQEQESHITYGYETARWLEEEYGEALEYSGVPYSFSSNVSPIYYMDGTYISFLSQNYDYTGGAHGMPYWIGYVFNLQTGEELSLPDIIEIDDITLKELVTKYFTKMYDEEPEAYWGNAVDTVYEYTNLESPFYLNEEGIVFYFGPYDLAPYAGGFQEIMVPYSEFNLKIPLK